MYNYMKKCLAIVSIFKTFKFFHFIASIKNNT